MFDIIAAIGLREAGSFLAKDVLLPLFKGSLEDDTKDFFKGCIRIRLAKPARSECKRQWQRRFKLDMLAGRLG
ncbi:hypothetical protein [Pseudanabaena sp. FACHB-2040]|uniref:hypothetical protein n=1 Tax=Pseudanabaena sp. FACHB-2040 TaxID=2692859 RepID=UPI001685FB1D|nr:hypothetical protein [Pseudanabaena sp. FACHB-2040]MBD2256552.1 hypothetical protein [Pseudanabaena sp. FACHB-2040]